MTPLAREILIISDFHGGRDEVGAAERRMLRRIATEHAALHRALSDLVADLRSRGSKGGVVACGRSVWLEATEALRVADGLHLSAEPWRLSEDTGGGTRP